MYLKLPYLLNSTSELPSGVFSDAPPVVIIPFPHTNVGATAPDLFCGGDCEVSSAHCRGGRGPADDPRKAHGTTEPFGTTRKGCIRYTGVRVDGWFHFIRFLLYTKSVVPEYSLCMRNHGTRLTCSPVAYLFTFLCTTKILATHILSTHILYIY